MQYFLAIFLIIGIIVTGGVFAQDRNANDGFLSEELERIQQSIQERMQTMRSRLPSTETIIQELPPSLLDRQGELQRDLRDRFQEERERFTEYMQALRTNLTSAQRAKTEELKARQQQFLQDHREKLLAQKEEIQKRGEEIKIQRIEELRQRQEELRQNMQERFSDGQVVAGENFSERLNRLNDVLTDRYSGRIGAFETVLDKMELRAQILEVADRDVSDALSAVAAAREVIIEARELILDQKEKVYVVEIIDEESPGESFRVILREFQQDHKELRDNVMRPIISAMKEALNALKEARVGSMLTEDDLGNGEEGGEMSEENGDDENGEEESNNN